ncbi:hypothetical protein CXB51_034283 [Gossypium anomalum]|uniref:Uncharacterized protein n=1 Tax=Gossypium anomalum TaxID=47600 RepID=A0A8J5Y0W1_9ROSI|nr:hypothetical protein CXB51_034283 [Gossypium anomalum]
MGKRISYGQSSHGHAVGGLTAGGTASAYGAHRIAHGHGGLFGRGKFKHEGRRGASFSNPSSRNGSRNSSCFLWY